MRSYRLALIRTEWHIVGANKRNRDEQKVTLRLRHIRFKYGENLYTFKDVNAL
jgi:hypothetical protein